VFAASNVVAVTAGDIHSLFSKGDGTLWAMGYNDQRPIGRRDHDRAGAMPESVASNVAAVAAGNEYSLYLKG
jgi:alpha-tubulin suppressor-like RCC1 family protein